MDRLAAAAAFLAVADEGGFSAAARRVGVAPSSLTRQVDALETFVGARLLNRSTRNVTLTDAGVRYREDLVRILDDLGEADQAAREDVGPPSGVLRVSLPSAFARLHVAPFLPELRRRCPGLELDVSVTDALVNLVEERIDVAIRLGVPSGSSLVARRLAPHRRVLCASPDYLDERGVPTCPKDLAGHECLGFTQASDKLVWSFRGLSGDVEDVALRSALRANSSEVLHEAALGGAGLLLMPSWLVGGDLKAGRLRAVLPEWTAGRTADTGAISALYLPNRRGSRKVGTFVDYLLERFGSPPYWESGIP